MATIMPTNLLLEEKNLVELNIPKLRRILKEKFEIDVPSKCNKFLERCLRQKDGNMEKALKLVQSLYQVSSDFKTCPAKLEPSSYDVTYYKLPILCPLITRDNLGRRLYCGQSKLWYPDKITFEDVCTATWMMGQIAGTNVEDQKHGFVVILDMDAFSLRQACAVNHRKLLRFCKWIQGGVLGRVKGIHFINHPRVVQLLYQGVKPFLTEKMRNRVKFHRSVNELQDSIELNPTLLPKFLGGELEVEGYMDQDFMKNLLNSSEFFQDMISNRLPIK